MPSKSKAQARFVRVQASKGKKWAKEWANADSKRGTKHLPSRKHKSK